VANDSSAFIQSRDSACRYELRSPRLGSYGLSWAIPYPRLEPPIFHGSVFLPASGNGTYGNAAGLAGLVLMIVGGVTAVGSILARRANHPSVAGAESRMY